jgi:C2 domain
MEELTIEVDSEEGIVGANSSSEGLLQSSPTSPKSTTSGTRSTVIMTTPRSSPYKSPSSILDKKSLVASLPTPSSAEGRKSLLPSYKSPYIPINLMHSYPSSKQRTKNEELVVANISPIENFTDSPIIQSSVADTKIPQTSVADMIDSSNLKDKSKSEISKTPLPDTAALPKIQLNDRIPIKAVDEESLCSILSVHILHAKNLPEMKRINHSADPFVDFYVGETSSKHFRTTVQWGSLSPTWIESFNVPMNILDTSIFFSIFDASKSGDCELIGTCSVPLSTLKSGKMSSLVLPVSISEKKMVSKKLLNQSFLKVELKISKSHGDDKSPAQVAAPRRKSGASSSSSGKRARAVPIIDSPNLVNGRLKNTPELRKFSNTISRSTLDLLNEYSISKETRSKSEKKISKLDGLSPLKIFR